MYKSINIQRISEWYRTVLNNVPGIEAKETTMLRYDQKHTGRDLGCHRPVSDFKWKLK